MDVSERQRLLTWIERLGHHPEREGDFSEREPGGRDAEVAIVASHAIVWWVDSPVREIKVASIRAADV